MTMADLIPWRGIQFGNGNRLPGLLGNLKQFRLNRPKLGLTGP